MSAQHKLTTVLQMAYALMWTDHFNVYANQNLQEMEKPRSSGRKRIQTCHTKTKSVKTPFRDTRLKQTPH